MGILIEVIILGVVAFAILALVGTQLSAKAGNKAKRIISAMDKKYEDYIKKQMTFSVLSSGDEIDTKKIEKDTLTVLKPDIEALISFIAATKNASDVRIKYSSKYFQNISSLAEKYFRITDENETTEMKPDEIKEFYDAVKSGVQADLARRVLDMRTGNLE